MKAFAKTDIGKARDINQDYYYISEEQSEFNLYILADGMGGYNGGEVASKLAIESAKRYIDSNFDKIEHTKEAIIELVKNAVEYSNMVVYERSKEDKDLEGMGTTLDICLIYNTRIYIGHIGDSRIYRVRNNLIRKLTKDHSYVQKLIEDGTITREEAMTHPKRNMLMKALGCTPYAEPDLKIRRFQPGDVLLMCSDGLTNMVKDDEIYNEIKNSPEHAPERLVEKANNAGGYDNITIITII